MGMIRRNNICSKYEDLRNQYCIDHFVKEAKKMLFEFGTEKIFWTYYKRAEYIQYDDIRPVWTPYPYGLTGNELKSSIGIKGMRMFLGGKETINPKVKCACMEDGLKIEIVDDWTLMISWYKLADKNKIACTSEDEVVDAFMYELKYARERLGSYVTYWSFFNTMTFNKKFPSTHAEWSRKPYECNIASGIHSSLFRQVILHEVNGRYHINPEIKAACAKEGLRIELYDFWTVRVVTEWKKTKTDKAPYVERISKRNDAMYMPTEVRFLWEAYYCMKTFKSRQVVLEYQRRHSSVGGFFYCLMWMCKNNPKAYNSRISVEDLGKIINSDNTLKPSIVRICKEVEMDVTVSYNHLITVKLL